MPILKNWYVFRDKLCGDIHGVGLNPIFVNGINIISFIDDKQIEIDFIYNVENLGKVTQKKQSTIIYVGKMDKNPKIKERTTLWWIAKKNEIK
jgi:hypothetical protein